MRAFHALSALVLGTAWIVAAAPASAQAPVTPAASPAGPSSAQAEAGEPRANTSAQEEAGEPRAHTSGGGEGKEGAGTSAPPPPTDAPAPRKGRAGSQAPSGGPEGKTPVHEVKGAKAGATDRLELGTATVTGDREQPKVMYIVPWKKSDIGDLSGKPMNSLLDEALAPVDRDVFKREVLYYNVVKADASQNGAQKPPGQGEK
ncbi:MAG TPA: hypothetical protein VKT22_02505 [Steroidobacteraceae bacterium]|nr:hypothetical protein [Steroidobacteraceae bacterium]